MRVLLVLLCVLLLHPTLVGAESAATYRVDFVVGFKPESGDATVAITVTPGSGRLQRLRMNLDPARHHGVEGDGRISREDNRLTWRPGDAGPATLRYAYKVERQRGNGAFDARITPDWALLRADRLIPPAAVLAPVEASSESFLRFDLPKGWSNAEISYRHSEAEGRYVIDNPGRRFQQPLGWMIAGDVGTRRDDIEGMEVVVAAPRGEGMRRNDILAFINTSAMEMRHAFGALPPKMLIVGAGDPMWRGGLSAPNSIYLHADRPLIGEGGTSPLLHEMTHALTRIRGVKGQDWIAEAFAEYYSLTLLRRSGLVTESRAERALDLMRRQGRTVRTLTAVNSRGPRTMRGVLVLVELDEEIRKATRDEQGLDAVTRQLVGRGRLSVDDLRKAADAVIGEPSKVLRSGILAGK